MTSPYASKDLFFEKALKSLPTALLEAMIAADLTNPGVLRLYPRYSSAELELLPEVVHVDLEDTAQSCTVSSSITQRMLRIGAAEAAKSTSSCHELDVVVSGVSSSSVSASVSLPVSLADGHPTSNATDLKGTPKKLAEVDEGPADGHTASCAPDLSGIAASTDSLATPVQKSADFPIKMGRFPRISQKSWISEKVRESPPGSGLARLDGGVAIKPVRESGSQNLRAETLSNGSLEDRSATRSKDERRTQGQASRDTDTRGYGQELREGCPNKATSAHACVEDRNDEGDNGDKHNTEHRDNSEEAPERCARRLSKNSKSSESTGRSTGASFTATVRFPDPLPLTGPRRRLATRLR